LRTITQLIGGPVTTGGVGGVLAVNGAAASATPISRRRIVDPFRHFSNLVPQRRQATQRFTDDH
jgi:hypothetical protein